MSVFVRARCAEIVLGSYERRYASDSQEDGYHAEAAEAAAGHGRRFGTITHPRTTPTNILTPSYRGSAESYVSIACILSDACGMNRAF